jgi:hypothetical protein
LLAVRYFTAFQAGRRRNYCANKMPIRAYL